MCIDCNWGFELIFQFVFALFCINARMIWFLADSFFLSDGVCFLVFNFSINDVGFVFWEEGS